MLIAKKTKSEALDSNTPAILIIPSLPGKKRNITLNKSPRRFTMPNTLARSLVILGAVAVTRRLE